MPGVSTPFHHVLVPIDGSQPSTVAGQLAIQLSAFHEAHITFVYVVDEALVEEMAHISGKVTQQVQREVELSGQRHLDYLSRLASEAGLAANQAICHGVSYSEIADLACEQGVDLIIIGQLGCHGARRILIGSITERVIEYAPCSVLVVK
jgi:nucleotide-binding universal stress UspA family protein